MRYLILLALVGCGASDEVERDCLYIDGSWGGCAAPPMAGMGGPTIFRDNSPPPPEPERMWKCTCIGYNQRIAPPVETVLASSYGEASRDARILCERYFGTNSRCSCSCN